MQFSDASSTPSAAVTDIPNMVNQLIAAYTPGQEDSSSSQAQQQSAAMLSTNPALAIIQALETSGAMGSTLADSVANSVMAQAG
jgi:hypothetical protein